jgi:hypothetical protein
METLYFAILAVSMTLAQVARADNQALDQITGQAALTLAQSSFGINIARGQVPSWTYILKGARNADVDTGTEGIDAEGMFTLPTTARKHHIYSSDADDFPGDTGARTIGVWGLNSAYQMVSETVNAAGVSGSVTTLSFVHVYRVRVLTAGTSRSNEGILYAVAETDGTTTCAVSATMGQTSLSAFIVPDGYTGYLTEVETGAQVGGSVLLDVGLWVRPFGGANLLQEDFQLSAGGSLQNKSFTVPYKVEAKTLIYATATSSGNNSDVHLGFTLLLVPN